MNNTDLSTHNPSNTRTRYLEWVFSILGALNCIGVSLLFLSSELQHSEFASIWPLPALYLFEIIIIGILCVISVAMVQNWQNPIWAGIPWISSGILLAFVILGAWTIGFFLIPAMILFLVAGIMADRRLKGDFPLHLIFFVAAGIGQSVLVLLTLI